MKKKVTSLLLVFVMMLSMMATAITAYAAANASIIITSDKTEAFPGDEISFTVAIGPVTELAGIEFKLETPAGLTFKSGALVDGIQSKLGASMCGFNANNQKVVIVGGMNYTSSVNTDILVVTYTVNADFRGDVTLGFVADSVVFINPSSEDIDVTVVNTESKVTVVDRPIAATGVALNKSTISLKNGDSEKLVATVTPANSVAVLTWTSSNTEVATVANDGTVTAVAKGSAVITVMTDNNLTATCNVTVACAHKSTEYYPEVVSTCSVQGNGAYTMCNDCGEIIAGSNEKLPLDVTYHINSKKVDAVVGTCVEPGHAEYVICEDCNTVISGSDAPVAGAHGAFVNKIADEYLVSAADCTNSAVYKKSCEICGVASATEIFVGGAALGHTYSDTWNKGDDSHWLECTVCGIKSNEEAHKFVDGLCSVCGFADNHTHTLVLVAAVDATCTTDGNVAYYTCAGCDEWFADANGADIIANKETVKVAALGHKWAEATCTAPKTCSACKLTEGSALGHKITMFDEKAATCTEAGYTAGKKCSNCDYSEGLVEIPATGHDFADATCTAAKTCKVCNATEGAALGHTWADATCTAAKTCTVCNATEGAALGHDITKLAGKAATCTEAGLTDGEKCSRCDYAVAQETIPAAGHKWTNATCTTAKTCTVCNVTEGAALGHDIIHTAAKDATCTEAGATAGEKCSRCDYSISVESIPALGHALVKVDGKAATCTEAGLTDGEKCSRCDYVKAQDSIPALGHIHVIISAVEPTCTESGLTEGVYCSRCDAVLAMQTVIDALGHDMMTDKAVAPTCTQTGLTEGEHCLRCNVKVAQQVVDALGHKFADATCTAANTCTVCNATEGEALGHKFADATCTTAKTCTVCNATEGEALGHDITKVDGKAATCTEAGITDGESCSRCDYVVAQVEIPATGHDFADATCTEAKTCKACNVTEGEALGHKFADATCTTAKTCTVCKVTEGEALGHNFGEWVVVKEPTSAEEGLAERVCACGEKETKTLEKLAYLIGDANLDGSITAADARIILRISAKIDTLEKYNITIANIDANFDGSITAADARIVLRVSAKLQEIPVKK